MTPTMTVDGVSVYIAAHHDIRLRPYDRIYAFQVPGHAVDFSLRRQAPIEEIEMFCRDAVRKLRGRATWKADAVCEAEKEPT